IFAREPVAEALAANGERLGMVLADGHGSEPIARGRVKQLRLAYQPEKLLGLRWLGHATVALGLLSPLPAASVVDERHRRSSSPATAAARDSSSGRRISTR